VPNEPTSAAASVQARRAAAAVDVDVFELVVVAGRRRSLVESFVVVAVAR
jgi:hypothetical protein